MGTLNEQSESVTLETYTGADNNVSTEGMNIQAVPTRIIKIEIPEDTTWRFYEKKPFKFKTQDQNSNEPTKGSYLVHGYRFYDTPMPLPERIHTEKIQIDPYRRMNMYEQGQEDNIDQVKHEFDGDAKKVKGNNKKFLDLAEGSYYEIYGYFPNDVLDETNTEFELEYEEI